MLFYVTLPTFASNDWKENAIVTECIASAFPGQMFGSREWIFSQLAK